VGQESLSKTEKCILKFKEVHGDRYDYDKVIYIKNMEKVIITCKKHGDFLQTPANHKRGQGCPVCGRLRKKNLTHEQILNKFILAHGDRYNYNKVSYINQHEKVIITCKEHGDFLQTPLNHLQKHGCPKCALNDRQNTEGIIKVFRNVHGDRYNYDKVDYKRQDKKVIITCKEHGDFLITPGNHRQGSNCPKCREYHSYYRDRNYYKGKKTILYHIFFPEYNLYKVGITISSVKQRFKYDNIEYKILSEEVYNDGALAFDKEQKILEQTKEFKYIGESILKSGNTELRYIITEEIK